MTAFFCLALVILLAGYVTAQQKERGKNKPKRPPAQPARDVIDEIEGR